MNISIFGPMSPKNEYVPGDIHTSFTIIKPPTVIQALGAKVIKITGYHRVRAKIKRAINSIKSYLKRRKAFKQGSK